MKRYGYGSVNAISYMTRQYIVLYKDDTVASPRHSLGAHFIDAGADGLIVLVRLGKETLCVLIENIRDALELGHLLSLRLSLESIGNLLVLSGTIEHLLERLLQFL